MSCIGFQAKNFPQQAPQTLGGTYHHDAHKKASLPNSLADTGLPQYMALGRECDMNIMLGDGLSGKRP